MIHRLKRTLPGIGRGETVCGIIVGGLKGGEEHFVMPDGDGGQGKPCEDCERLHAALVAAATGRLPERGTSLKRFAVFAIRQTKVGTIWVRAGVAFQNRDGSINVDLDVLPLEGKLSLRDAPADGKEKP